MQRIGIVGGGCSGALLATQLLSRTDHEVTLFDAGGAFARGVAYSTTHRVHIMNVRAGSLSAFPDDPDHFVRWLRASSAAGERDAFVPRRLYGDYLSSVLQSTEPSRLRCVPARVCGLDGDVVRTVDGRDHPVDRTVVAIGNLLSTPSELRGLLESDRYIDDPWSPEVGRIWPDDDVLIVGTGLTAVDVVLSLAVRGHTGRITAISRHGLLPQAHRETPPVPVSIDIEGTTARSLLRSVRRAAASVDDWRDVVDALRPQTQSLWRSLPPCEQARFLRLAARYWEVHRHRAAPSVVAAIDALRARGTLVVERGRISCVSADASGVDVAFNDRTLRADVVVNCTGPTPYVTCTRDPLLRGLLASGRAVPGPHGMGLDVTPDGALRDRDGAVSDTLFAIGPLRRGALWETTAVPEIRTQAAELASHLAA